MNQLNKRVLVGMSGGIDSSATCIMLQEQGYEVVGLTMRVWGDEEQPLYIQQAQELAQRLGIVHYVADERIPFRATVVQNFIDEYLAGRTPNPCVMCNPMFKFRILCEWADRVDCSQIATGHYSRLEKLHGCTYIIAGDDEKKDQSYFLWRLPQKILSRCLFPLGIHTKEQTRHYLCEKGFEAKSKEGESMEVCFVKGDYRDFLREHMPEIDTRVGKGSFVDAQGKKMGTHKGYPYYTVGQRKGLEIALGQPAYVLRINSEKNTVMLGNADQLQATHMLVDHFNPVDPERFFSEKEVAVRIRYRSQPIPCTTCRVEDGKLLVTFLGEASAITPGQSAVFYVENRVIGGSLIASQRGIGMYLANPEIQTPSSSLEQ